MALFNKKTKADLKKSSSADSVDQKSDSSSVKSKQATSKSVSKKVAAEKKSAASKSVSTKTKTAKKTVKKEPVKAKVKAKKESSKVEQKNSTPSKGNAWSVLLGPVITEKANNQAEGVYVFKVATTANKVEIKRAIQQLYGVWPTKVNVINCRSEKKRFGRYLGQTKRWRKAIVYLSKPVDIYAGI